MCIIHAVNGVDSKDGMDGMDAGLISALRGDGAMFPLAERSGKSPPVESLPCAIILTCAGAGDGALGVVRALGRFGIRTVVVSDQSDTPAGLSRYCSRFIHLPELTRDDAHTLQHLVRLAQESGPGPVLFPTSDPDLLLVARLEADLQRHYRVVTPPTRLVFDFTDKRRFAMLARQHQWPTPQTFVLRPGADVREWSNRLHHPAIVKPATPQSWTVGDVPAVTGHAKALQLASEAETVRICQQLSALGAESVVQEYIPGPDNQHYDLHACVDPERGVLGCFTGRKIRVHPAGAGSGCYVESVYVQDVVDLGLQVLRDVGYRGLANINFKYDARTDSHVLFEVNPRVSAWNILGTECGVALPVQAYAHTAGLECPPLGRQRDGVRYVNLRNDVKSYCSGLRGRPWAAAHYVQSLLYRPLIHQTLSVDDPLPSLVEARRSILACLRRLGCFPAWQRLKTFLAALRPQAPSGPSHVSPQSHRTPPGASKGLEEPQQRVPLLRDEHVDQVPGRFGFAAAPRDGFDEVAGAPDVQEEGVSLRRSRGTDAP